MWLRRSTHRGIEVQARQLIGESESFLLGGYARTLQAQGSPVPYWAWLSALAHTPVESLMTRGDRGRARRYPDHVTALWQGAVDLLAQELFTTAERTGSSVEEVQRAVIADVELQRPWAESGASVLGPSRLVHDVQQVLCRFRGSSRPEQHNGPSPA
jgi:hypothetical protein